MEYICQLPGIKDYKDKYKNQCALIVGAGPDMDDEKIEQIKQIQDNVYILSTDAMLMKLKAAGCRVDFVFSLERTPDVANFWKDIPPQVIKDTLLFAIPVLERPFIDAYSGYMVNVIRPFSHFQYLEMDHLETIDTGPSSANMALNVGEYMGFTDFILAGINLSTQNKQKSHADGTIPEVQIPQEELQERIIDGKVLYTHPTWDWFHLEFERFVFKQKGKINVYNSTKDGRPINGTLPVKDLVKIGKKFKREIPFLYPPVGVEVANERWQKWSVKKGIAEEYLSRLIKKCDITIKYIQVLHEDCFRDAAFADVATKTAEAARVSILFGGTKNLYYYLIGHLAQTHLLEL